MEDDQIAGALNALAARQDAMAAAWIALAITVCRTNPRAQAHIESAAIEWSLRRAHELEAQGLSTPAGHMQQQLEVLLQTLRLQMQSERKKR